MGALTIQRLAPWAGLLFILFFLVGIGLQGDAPSGTDPDSEVIAYFEDSDNQTQFIASAYALTIAGMSFLLFLLGLRDRLAQAEAPYENLSRLALVSGVLMVAMLFVLAATLAAVPAGTAFQDEPVDAAVARFLPHVGFGAFLLAGLFSASGLIFATSLLTVRTGVLPAWTAWLGFVAAVALLFGVLFFTGVALLIWVLVISISLFTRRPAAGLT